MAVPLYNETPNEFPVETDPEKIRERTEATGRARRNAQFATYEEAVRQLEEHDRYFRENRRRLNFKALVRFNLRGYLPLSHEADRYWLTLI